ncbi:MAG: TM2 domain-containing protein [Rhizomicrobium sp.]
MVYCRGCGKEIHETATACPSCGARQRGAPGGGPGKSKVVAGVLALFLGGLGVHRFYLGQWWGIFYLLFCWTFIPSIVAFIEAIVFFVTDDASWEAKYGFA